MAKKRGRKPGVKKAEKVEKVVKKDITLTAPPHVTDGDPLETDRMGMYAEYAKRGTEGTGLVPVPDLEDTDVASDVKEEPSQEEVKKEVEQEVLEEKVALRDDREDVVKAEEQLAKVTEERKKIITEPSSEEMAKQEKGIPENDFIKTVPYDALFAEREKRKELKKQNDELLAKLAEQERIKDLSKEEVPTMVDDEIVTRAELNKYVKELEELKSKQYKGEEQIRADEFNNSVATVDRELTEAGYPGFKAIGQHVVADRINQIQLEDPDLASAFQNPGGWKKLYMEEFPSVKSMFTQQVKEEAFDKKAALKSQANLVSSHGKTDRVEAKPAELSQKEKYDNYIKLRRERAL